MTGPREDKGGKDWPPEGGKRSVVRSVVWRWSAYKTKRSNHHDVDEDPLSRRFFLKIGCLKVPEINMENGSRIEGEGETSLCAHRDVSKTMAMPRFHYLFMHISLCRYYQTYWQPLSPRSEYEWASYDVMTLYKWSLPKCLVLLL